MTTEQYLVLEQDQTFQMHFFKKTDRKSIEFIAESPVPTELKTIASLHGPSNYASIPAMSGWNHGETKITMTKIVRYSYLRRIKDLCLDFFNIVDDAKPRSLCPPVINPWTFFEPFSNRKKLQVSLSRWLKSDAKLTNPLLHLRFGQ